MKKYLLMAFMAVMPILLQGQDVVSSQNDQHVVYKTIPKKMKINDKIIVQNKSSYYILQVVVALVGSDKEIKPLGSSELQPLGSSVNLAPGASAEIASFDKNRLKKLRNRLIAIKVKATKGKDLANVDPSDITYDFKVNLSEVRHDLYINLYSDNLSETGRGVMDF